MINLDKLPNLDSFPSELMRTPSPKPFESLKTKFRESYRSRVSLDTTFDDNLLVFSKDTLSSGSLSLEILEDNSDASSTKSSENNEENYTMLNSTLNQKKKITTDETKYKTELCKKFTETGQCPYGKKCKFAHGKQELNEKMVVNKNRYKSKKCNSFHTNMTCPYGIRCLFAHEERTIQELNESNNYGKFIHSPELLDDFLVRNKYRLPVFVREVECKSKPDDTQSENLFYGTFQPASRELGYSFDKKQQ